jgi:hypothetical protein
MPKDEQETVSGSDPQAPADRMKAYQVISFLEVGIKAVVNVPEACTDPFRCAAKKGNEKARERIFDLEWDIADLIDAENLMSTLVDPPNEDPASEDRWDYTHSRWFFDEEAEPADDRLDSGGAVAMLRGQESAVDKEATPKPLVAVVEGTGDWALIANGKVYLTGGEDYANCGWPASLEHLLEAFPTLPRISIRNEDLPEEWGWHKDVLPRINDIRNESEPQKAN